MSADTVMPSLQARRHSGVDAQQLIGRSVDVYDVAAHLEANGQGDAAARLAGHADVFTLAHEMVAAANSAAAATPDRTRRQAARIRRTARTRVHNAVFRVVTMLSGIVICLAVINNELSPTVLFVTGAIGWVLTQLVSSAVWSGLGTTGRAAAADDGLIAASLAFTVAVVAALALGTPMLLAWAGWSIALAVIAVLDDVRRVAAAATGAALLIALAPLTGSVMLPVMLAITAVSLALARAGWVLVTARPAGMPRLSRGAAPAVGYAMVQTGGQILVLWFILLSLGPASFAAVALAGLVAGAVADPVLEIAQAAVYQLVRGGAGWVHGRRRAVLIGTGAVAMIMISALVTVVLHRLRFDDEAGAGSLVAGALIISALVAGTGVLLRSGSARGAATLSAVGATAVGVATLLGAGSLLAVGLVAVALALFTSVLGAREMASPVLW